MIGLSEAKLGDAEQAAAIKVIQSGWITQGETVKQFEGEFARHHSFEHAVAISSCTAGLHMALVAAGVNAGDEVLIPSLSFVAAANTVVQLGATPVFMDIEKLDRPHVSLSDAESRVTSKTRAVMVMDYGGYLIDTQPWRVFADKHNLSLIDDTAHAAGANQKGNVADFCTYSFFGNKNMTTAEGGMICTNSSANDDVLRRIRSHGMTSSTLDRSKGHAYSYDVERLGFNYRMDEIRAAIGRVQLSMVNEWNATRQNLSLHYRHQLDEHQVDVTVPFSPEEAASCHLLPVVLPEGVDRQAIMTSLRENDIQSSIHYPPIHQFTHYRNAFEPASLPLTEAYCARELTLPLHPGLTTHDVSKVVVQLNNAIKSR